MKRVNWGYMLLCILISELMGFAGICLSGNILQIYRFIYKPELAPSAVVFAVVLPVVYLCMGIVFYMVVSEKGVKGNVQLRWFCIQLIINLIWPVVFFRYRYFLAAALLVILLDIVLTRAIYYLFEMNGRAGCLMFPVFIWSLFSTYLCVGCASMNI